MRVSLVKPYAAYVEAAVSAYIEAALWTTPLYPEDGSEPLGCLDSEYGPEDIAPESLEAIRADVEAFVLANWVDLAGMDAGQAGHDFLLTRDHHGAGFWDRGLGDSGDRLTSASHPYGDSGLYVGDDGQIHVS